MKYLSLFSGIGGFELGIQQAYESKYNNRHATKQQSKEKSLRHKRDKSNIMRGDGNRWRTNPICIGYSEIDKYACQIYDKQFKHKNYGDITKINIQKLPDFDLLVGGFPCQSFSIAGKRGGFKDTRGTLFFNIAEIIKIKRPQIICLENVKGLLSHNEGNTFATIISTIDELGYDCQWQVLNSKNFGVPQNRERVFIIGHLRGTPRPKVFPIEESNQGNNEKQLSRKKTNDRENISDTKNRGRRSMLTGQNTEVGKIRRLTPIECERLQGFPDNWTEGLSNTQRYKTLGNAVTVNVIKEIFKRL
tara:strand:- start:380 stop:1291 length:912 start_codon:yes stop_codon:yes gene_type:complete